MVAPPTAHSLLDQLSESGLLTPLQIRTVSHELATKFGKNGVPTSNVGSYLIERGMITRFQFDRLLEGRTRGFFYDQYKVLDLLGVGGMGWVYRAIDTKTQQVVALKVLLEQLKHDRGMLARFQQEARLTMKLHHPNIVRTFHLGYAGGMHYMIMEFVHGPTLLEVLLKIRNLPWGLSCEIIRQAALGLQCAHDAGFVHRDIKPQNLIIDAGGGVKILDFGLAMLRDGESGEEFSMAMIFGHESVGTAAYMAPEQFVDSLNVDSRADIYGLGCTLFASLTGRPVFSETKVDELRKAHQSQQPRSVCDLNPSIPSDVGKIVLRMLAKDPNERFGSAGEVAEALSKWSRPQKIEFDVESILAERRKQAEVRLAEYLKSRPKPSGLSSATARVDDATFR
ncbi:MAG: serine/threonine protein kinase, partial [Planctomycetes bacterium]|nr:serine/threonine protein kinase [Planctomycetota bacterium]